MTAADTLAAALEREHCAVLTAGLREFLSVDRVPVSWVCARAKAGERQ